jgi:hypothetical protein
MSDSEKKKRVIDISDRVIKGSLRETIGASGETKKEKKK